MIRINPELQRYLWLEFSAPRTIGMPVVLALIFYLIFDIAGSEPASVAAITLFILLAGIWGTAKVSESVIDEINNNTWDLQRLSSLSPLQLMLGKLFGSCSYMWYGGLMALMTYISLGIEDVVKNTVLVLLCVLCVHALTLLSSLSVVQNNTAGRTKISTRTYYLGGLFFCLFLIPTWKKHVPTLISGWPVSWYGYDFDLFLFTVSSLIIFYVWLLLGIFNNLKTCLQMRTGPWVWLGFLFYAVIYCAGFDPQNRWTHILTLTYLFGLSSAYVLAFMQPLGIVKARKLTALLKMRNWNEVLKLTPRWLFSLAICLSALLASKLTLPTQTNDIILLGIFVFAVRDIAFLHYVKFNTQNRRPYLTVMFYLFLVYVLLPWLFHITGVSTNLLLPFDVRSYLLTGHAAPSTWVISGAIQCAIVIWLLRKRWNATAQKLVY